MKYLKYAGLCAAGFFTEYLLSVVFSAFVTLLVLYPAAAIPCGILSGKFFRGCFYGNSRQYGNGSA